MTCQYLAIVGPHLVCRHCNDHRPTIHADACSHCLIRDWPCVQPKRLPSESEIQAWLDGVRLIGDRIAALLKRLGFKTCCGCNGRRDKLNRLHARLRRVFPQLWKEIT